MGAKRLGYGGETTRVENRGETTRGETIRGGNVLEAKRLVTPHHDKTNKMACTPSENSAQPKHQPSLIRVFAVCSMGS